MEDYHVLEVIGEGSFGRVYKGRRKFTKQVSFLPVWRLSLSSTCDDKSVCMAWFNLQIVALKFIPKLNKSTEDLLALQREVGIMRELRHENIIALYDWFETNTEVGMGEPHPLIKRYNGTYYNWTQSPSRCVLSQSLQKGTSSRCWRMTVDCQRRGSSLWPVSWSLPSSTFTHTASYTAT